MSEHMISIALLSAQTATGTAVALLKNAEDQFGFVPNLYAHMANMPGLLENYIAGYEKFRTKAGFSPAEQETILLTISSVNGCHYCMAAHSMVADKMHGMNADLIAALRNGAVLPDPKLNALSAFTRKMVTSRGRPDAPVRDAFFAAGYDSSAVLGVILGISVKTLSNYVNLASDTPLDAAFADYAVAPLV